LYPILGGPFRTSVKSRKENVVNEGKGTPEIPSKGELLILMSEQGIRWSHLFIKAEAALSSGDLTSAGKLLTALIAVSREQLDTALLHNGHYEPPVDIPPIVQPMINATLNLADVREAQGRRDEAETLRATATDLAREYLGGTSQAETEKSRAAALLTEARFNEALVALAAARDFFRCEKDFVNLAGTTLRIAELLRWLGDHERALVELKQTAEIIAPLIPDRESPVDSAAALLRETLTTILSGGDDLKAPETAAKLYTTSIELDFQLACVHKEVGNLEEAERLFRKVLPYFQRSGSNYAIEYQLVALLVAKGKPEEALAYAERLEPHFVSQGFLRPKLAALLKLQAEARLSLGDAEAALDIVERGIEDLSTYYDPDLLWKLQRVRGDVLEATGRKRDALKSYVAAADTVKNLRKAPLGYRLDSTYLRDKFEMFEHAIGLACDAGEAEVCCGLMETIKSRTLTCTLSIPRQAWEESPEGLEDRFDDLTRQLDAVEYQGYLNGWTEELQRKREAVQAERAEVSERLRFSDPRWRNMTEPVPFDLTEVAKVLSKKSQAALSLFYTPDRIISVLIKDGESRVAGVDVSSEVSSKLADYHANLQSTQFQPEWFDLSGALSVEAEDLVSPELLEEGLNAGGIVVIPHGPLHLVPWAGLVFQGKRLFEYCPVGVLPNLSCILNLSDGFSGDPKVAIVGPPDYSSFSMYDDLDEAAEEVGIIADVYAGESRLLEGPLTYAKATEKKFWELAKRGDAAGGIFHIACHGELVPEAPMSSGLIFTDGKADAAEIARSSLAFDEVILSACSTGYRPVEVKDVKLLGDDIVGLPGAFLEAGVKSVLVSIPKAEDRATCEFMKRYHEERLEGKTPLSALQETQQAMLADERFAPWMWVGLTAYGCG
jgi:CHAT domain-containing protein/tetratricopeptide (TPR) repeat protein